MFALLTVIFLLSKVSLILPLSLPFLISLWAINGLLTAFRWTMPQSEYLTLIPLIRHIVFGLIAIFTVAFFHPAPVVFVNTALPKRTPGSLSPES